MLNLANDPIEFGKKRLGPLKTETAMGNLTRILAYISLVVLFRCFVHRSYLKSTKGS